LSIHAGTSVTTVNYAQIKTLAENQIDGNAAAFQAQLLPGVSRTFALTIPQLPESLRHIVTNAYLLCRIADTIEDDVGIDASRKREFHKLFVNVLQGQAPCCDFVDSVSPLLTQQTLAAERELIQNADKIVDITLSFDATNVDILRRHITTMCLGMPTFQHGLKGHGLQNLETLNRYCYCVAGVVGEMLTELFCNTSQDIAKHDRELMELAASFGQGLQMTNILKDVWDDNRNGTCWLPKDVFSAVGYDLTLLSPGHDRGTFTHGISQLIGIAHAHLRNALSYSLLIPRRHAGIRRFCLWSIGLAVLTLRRIHDNPRFTSGQQVKVSRKTVTATVLVTSAVSRSNVILRSLFDNIAAGLPLADALTGPFRIERTVGR